MESRLANRLLGALLEWDAETEARYVSRLMAMAEWKWDGYEGFRAGQRFVESLARWLSHFPDAPTRLRWIDFVLSDMIFLSSAEMDHLISVVYPDFIRPAIIKRVAVAEGIPLHRTAQISEKIEFYAEQRRLLVLGLSDGARLDLLRRASHGLSHEQFFPSVDIPPTKGVELVGKLNGALQLRESSADRTFNHVLLVDDFYGSGTSLIDFQRDEAGNPLLENGKPVLRGKIGKFIKHADSLFTVTGPGQEQDAGGTPVRVLSVDYKATILLYVASSRAIQHIQSVLERAGLSDRWRLRVVQILAPGVEVTDETLLRDCHAFWDPVLEDEHKKAAPTGYKNCALPLVLYHNSPNNSVCPLWADSTGRTKDGVPGSDRHALFPRYERHHSERP